jgi:arsenical pump membrane protein
MPGVFDELSPLWPALAFLLAGVPLAALLERVGFFDSVASAIARDGEVPVLALWIVAALTTVVLNLDTTIVLLTPLYLRIARRAGADPLPIAVVPLLLAGLASSVLPISNLTTLIAAERVDVGVADVVAHLALPTVAAVVAGWLVYRVRHPRVVAGIDPGRVDRRALVTGGLVVAGLLAGFVVGPSFGVDPWIVALAADVVLMAVTRTVPWRHVPIGTAVLVTAIGLVVALVVPDGRIARELGGVPALAIPLVALVAAGAANAINNLPALLVAMDGASAMSWGGWAWLLGVNAGAVLLPLGALANLLWARIVRAHGVTVPVRRYVSLVVPVALPAFVAAIGVLTIERLAT